MRSLPLTDVSRPGGRPRAKRHPRTPFGDWLASCAMTVGDLAGRLGIKSVTVYNLRNGYFRAGRDLAVAIEKISDGKVPVESWGAPPPKAKPKAKRKP